MEESTALLAEQDLQERLRFETLVTDLSNHFVNVLPEQLDGSILDALRRIGEVLGLDSCGVWQRPARNQRSLVATHVYRLPQVLGDDTDLDAEDHFPWILSRVQSGHVVLVDSPESLPLEAARDRETLERFGLKAWLVIPTFLKAGVLSGVMGFSATREVHWSPAMVKRMNLIGHLVFGAIARITADVALAASEARFRVLTEHSPCGVCIIEDGRFSYVNSALAEMFGYCTHELVGADPTVVINPDNWALVTESIRQCVSGKAASPPHEFWGLRKGGESVRILVLGVAAELGTKRVFVGNILDITESRRAEEAFRESEATSRAIIESTSELVWSVDPVSFGLLTFNARLRDHYLVDYGIAIEKGMRPEDLFRSASLVQLWNGHYQRALEEGPFVAEYTTSAGDLTLELRVNPLKFGEKSCGVSVFAKDITAQKHAQAERDRLITAIEQTGEIVIVTDTAGAIEYVNPAFESATGYGRAEVLGKKPSLLKSGKHDEGFYRSLWNTITAGRLWTGRFTNRKKDGTEYTEVASISPVRDATGAIAGFVAVKRDMTTELNLESQLIQSQKMETVGRLAGGVAHDFNNLLSVILSFLGFVIGETPVDDSRFEDLLQIKKATERASALTRQLVAFSRQQLMELESLEVNPMLAEMDRMLRRLIGEDVQLVLRPAPDAGMIRADRSQMEQVIMNLAVNARDAMPMGGTLTIETANIELDENEVAEYLDAEPGKYVRISVSDSGVGMDSATLRRMFEPFFTTKAPGKGTGLGLATVHGIIKQSGGSIRVTSEIGTGTRFNIFMPCAFGAQERHVRPSEYAAHAAGGSETILIVEDDEAVRLAAKRILRSKGYTVLTAASGPEALALMDHGQSQLDLVLTDLVMPKMSGRELVVRLAQHRPGIKVLLMSGYTDDEIVTGAIQRSGIRFLAKPFSQPTLLRKVRETLDDQPSLQPEARETVPHFATIHPQAGPRDLEEVRLLPSPMVAELRKATAAARYDDMMGIIARIDNRNANAARTLRQLGERYDYDGIRALLRTADGDFEP